jgi:alpha-mannosidase
MALMTYTFYPAQNFFDISVKICGNKADHLIKLEIPAKGECYSDSVFGTDVPHCDGSENVSQKWIQLISEESVLAIMNKSSYGSSREGDKLYISLLRSPAYTAHPIGDKQVLRGDRYTERMDTDTHDFEFRLFAGAKHMSKKLPSMAQVFNEGVYALSLGLPEPTEKKPLPAVEISDDSIILSAFKKSVSGGYIVRLFNNSDRNKKFSIKLLGHTEVPVELKKFEVKTFRYLENELIDCEEMEV